MHSDSSEDNVLNNNVTQTVVIMYISSNSVDEDDKWAVDIKVLSPTVVFRIDTGARCNTITLECYQQLMHTGELKCFKRILCTYFIHSIKLVAVVEM